MSTVARRIRATPERGASDAWQLIVDLIAPKDGAARRELLGIEGIASSIISTESPKDAAMVVRGKGARVRMYCLYDDDAIEGSDAKEDSLSYEPLKGEWAVSLPCPADDLAWVQRALKAKSSRITAREQSSKLSETEDTKTKSQALTLNVEAFLKS